MANIITDWFFEEEEQEDTKEIAQPAQSPKNISAKMISSSSIKDSSAYKMLHAALGKTATPNLESFQAALEAAADASVPEAMRYSFAFKMLAKMQGLTLAALQNDLQLRAQALEAQRPLFEKKVAERREQVLGAKQTELTEIQPKIAALRNEIEKLQEIEKNLTEEVGNEQRQIAEASKNFEAALQALQEEIAAEQQKLERYLRAS